MNEIYLTRLGVSEFRTFSECSIELPDGPGVLLVVGPNGLGKSTLFDALEWCLAGEIDRFQGSARGVAPEEYLRRWHAADDRLTRVDAAFGTEINLARELGIAAEGLVAGDDPTQALRSPDWHSEIANLHHYLLLTHFLGQSTLTRMTHRKAEERWEYLKGPAQSDWAKLVGQTLHGHGNSSEARAYINAIDDCQAKASRLEQLLAAEATQFEGARAEGAIAADDVVVQASQTIGRLVEAGLATPPSLGDGSAQTSLDELAAAVASAHVRVAQRDASLKRADDLLRRRAEASASIERLEADLAQLRVAMAGTLTTRQGLEATLQRRTSELEDAASQAAAEDERLTQLLGLLELTEDAQTRREDLSSLDVEIGASAGDLVAAEGRVAYAQRRLALAQRVERKIAELARQGELAAAQLTLLNQIEDAERELQATEARLREAEGEAPDLGPPLAAAQAAAAAAKEQEAATEFALDQARRVVDDLTAAVVRVANHITDATCSCPVCASEFPAGELRRRASAAAAGLGPSIAPLEQAASDAVRRLEAANAEVRRLESRRQELGALRDLVAAARTQRSKFVEQLPDPDADVDAVRLQHEDAMARAQARRARLDQRLSQLGTPGALQGTWSGELGRRNLLERQLADRRRSRAAAANALARLEEDIQSTAAELGVPIPIDPTALAGAIVDARAAQAAARSRQADAAAARASAQSAARDAADLAGREAAQEAELQGAIAQQRQILQDAEDSWRDLALGLMSTNAHAAGERQLQGARARVATAEQRLATLREGYAAGLRQEAHRQALDQLRRELGLDVGPSRDDLRRRATLAQEAAAARAGRYTRAQAIAKAAYTEINRRVGDFNRRYLQPVNELMAKFNSAILTEPEVGLELQFERNAVRQRARPLSRAPAAIKSLDPLLVHSEGQMAALAVSMLCAASTTFGWSRWRGLVMDDPLQHNDVLHASAFADLMRNLVRERRYQVLLSTHDAGQADFLRRKFVAGGVSCTTVLLVGQGQDGTVVDITSHLADAA